MQFTRKLMLAAALALALPALAQDSAKVPYWASIRSGEVNMRAGPGEDYRIAWVYHRPMLPLKVLRMKEGWRLVRDPGGTQGWVLARLLTRQRTGFVQGKEPADMREAGNPEAKLLWRLAPGVVGLLGDCDKGWCAFTVGPRKGFVEQSQLWGAGEP
jgi:SH3-like domain-containing protein